MGEQSSVIVAVGQNQCELLDHREDAMSEPCRVGPGFQD